jgi:hypothetical protein
MSPSNSRRQSHGYITTASAVEEVSLPTPRTPIHDYISTASGGEEVSRPNSGELSHGSIMIATGGQEVLPANSRGDHHKGFTSKFYVYKSHSLYTSKDKLRCLHFDMI